MSEYKKLVNYSSSSGDDEVQETSEEELFSSESVSDEEPPFALPPVPRRTPRVPPRIRHAPLNPFNVLIQVSLNEVDIVQPHSNSQEAWNKFCDAMAEKVDVMEQIVNYMKTSKDMRDLYAAKQRAGIGVVAWKHAFKSQQPLLIQMAQKVLMRNI